MNTTKGIFPRSWSTASFCDTAETMPGDLSALGDHLKHCRGGRARGRLFTLQCLAGSMNGFMAARFVTTLVVVALIIGAGILVL